MWVQVCIVGYVVVTQVVTHTKSGRVYYCEITFLFQSCFINEYVERRLSRPLRTLKLDYSTFRVKKQRNSIATQFGG